MMSWVYSRIYHQQYYYLGVKKSLIHPKWRAFNNIIRRSWTIRNRGFWILLVKLHTTYHLVMTHSLPWKDPPFLRGKPSISMGHLYHGYVSHNQRVHGFSLSDLELQDWMVSGDRAGARSLYLNVLNLDPDTPGILNITHLIYCTKDRFLRLLNPPHRKPWGMIYGLNFLRISYHHPSTPNVWMLRSPFLLVKFKIVCWSWFFVVKIHHFPWLNPALLFVVVGCTKSPITAECPTNKCVPNIRLPGLVNVYVTVENHHLLWVNPLFTLFLWPFSIAFFVCLPGRVITKCFLL